TPPTALAVMVTSLDSAPPLGMNACGVFSRMTPGTSFWSDLSSLPSHSHGSPSASVPVRCSVTRRSIFFRPGVSTVAVSVASASEGSGSLMVTSCASSGTQPPASSCVQTACTVHSQLVDVTSVTAVGGSNVADRSQVNDSPTSTGPGLGSSMVACTARPSQQSSLSTVTGTVVLVVPVSSSVS